MKTLDKILDTGVRFIMALAMLSLVAGGFWQIFTRWILNNPSTVTEEFMKYMLIWAGLIGSAYCFYKDQHLALDLFKTKAKGPVAVILTVFIEACILGFIIYVFIFGGFKLAASSTNSSPVMRLPFTFLYSVLYLSGIFIVAARILRYVQMIIEKKDKKKLGKESGGEA